MQTYPALARDQTAIEVQTMTAGDISPAAAYLAGLPSLRSRRTMLGCLDRMANLLCPEVGGLSYPWHLLRATHTEGLRAALMAATGHQTDKFLSPAYVNLCLAALKGVLRAAYLQDKMSGDDYLRATMVKNMPNMRLPRGRALAENEIADLLTACDDGTAAGARDRALLALLYCCGLRRQAAVDLDLADYDPETHLLRLLHNKGDKQMETFANEGTAAALAAWIEVRGDEPGPLFQRIRKAGAEGVCVIVPERLSGQAILVILEKRRKRAGLAACSPHDLRRTMISDMFGAGVDINTIRDCAGHSDVSTTSRYDRRGNDRKREAVEKLKIARPVPVGGEV